MYLYLIEIKQYKFSNEPVIFETTGIYPLNFTFPRIKKITFTDRKKYIRRFLKINFFTYEVCETKLFFLL